MKVIFFYLGTYLGGTSPMSKRLHYYAKGLKSQGIEISVWCLPSLDSEIPRGEYGGIPHRYLPQYVILSNYFLRTLNLFVSAWLYAYFMWFNIRKNQVVFMSGMGWFGQTLMILAVKLRGAKVALEVNENPYSPEGGRLDTLWIRKLRRYLTLQIPFRLADGFIVISTPLEKMVKRYRSKTSNIVKIPILCDVDHYLIQTPSKIFNEYQPYIFHAGALSETKDGVVSMVKAFILACKQTDQPLHFLYTSQQAHSSLKQKVDEMIETAGIKDRMVLVGKLSESDLYSALSSASLALVNKPANWQNDFNFPTKLGELLSVGVPVIASRTGEMANYLSDGVNALLVDADDADAMANKIIEIIENPNLSASLVKGGRHLAKTSFHYQIHTDKLSSFFRQLI